MNIAKDDARRIYTSLHAAANVIETGNPVMSAVDAEASYDHAFEKRYGRAATGSAKPRALTTEQMREVVALRDLAAKFLERM